MLCVPQRKYWSLCVGRVKKRLKCVQISGGQAARAESERSAGPLRCDGTQGATFRAHRKSPEWRLNPSLLLVKEKKS